MSIPFSQIKENEIKKRLVKFQAYLKHQRIDLCIIEEGLDLLYFTGLKMSYGRLYVHVDKCKLFVDTRYIEAAQKQRFVPVELLSANNEASFLQQVKPQKVGFDAAHISHMRFLEVESMVAKTLPFASLTALNHPTKHVRVCKDSLELKDIHHSALILKKTLKATMKKIKEGISEKELSLEFHKQALHLGAEGLAFEPIIAFGKNSAMPHHRAGSTKLKKNSIVLIDVGVIARGYHSDMTRVHFHGVPDPVLLRMLSIVKKAHKQALLQCKPGNRVGAIDEAARKEMRKEDMESYFIHSLGHGIGLETHEYPKVRFDGADKDVLLQPGMVLAIEPGLYIDNLGGVRWEDMVLITKDSHLQLTR